MFRWGEKWGGGDDERSNGGCTRIMEGSGPT